MAKQKICAADLNVLIEIQVETGTKTGMGGRTDEWSTITDVWAKGSASKARERVVAGKISSQTYHIFTIRWMKDVIVDAAMRVRYVDPQLVEHLFNVESVVDIDYAHDWVELHCIEGKAA